MNEDVRHTQPPRVDEALAEAQEDCLSRFIGNYSTPSSPAMAGQAIRYQINKQS